METMTGMQETIFSEGSRYFEALLQDIDQASLSIDLETYIFELDSVGRQVADHLAEASRRGVAVRLLVDGVGSSSWNDDLTLQLEQAGVIVRIFRPLPWHILRWQRSLTHLPWLAKIRHLLETMNRRNHRKICLIDRRLAWVGSFNISRHHLPRAQGGEGWRDTAVRLAGDSFDELQDAFDSAWVDDRFQIGRKIFSVSRFRLNHIRKHRLRHDLLARISLCHSRIWIANAYFVPNSLFLRHLKRAARKGVNVMILLPGNSDVFFIPWASAVFYQNLLKSGVRIFEYMESVLHVKIMIVDDWFTVGSSNLDHRSLSYNLEVDVVLAEPGSKTMVQEQFLDDLTHSQEVFLRDCPHRPWWKRAIGRLILYVKHWL